MSVFTREALGTERMAWLADLPRVLIHPPFALVHASPASAWRSPFANAGDAELESTYSPLGQALAVFGHIHQSFIRQVGALAVVNTGSVSQSFDGDPRAAYALINDGVPMIGRVEYDIEREIAMIAASRIPYGD